MATSETEICNSALVKLGGPKILSLDDDNERGRLCKEQYPKQRDSLLRNHPWNFAIKRLQLTKTANTPVYDYENEFQLPSDYLRIISTNLFGVASDSDKKVSPTFQGEVPLWTIEGDKLLTDSDTIKILYIRKETDVTLFEENFTELLAMKIAVDLCYALTGSNSREKALRDEYKNMLANFRTYDAQEGSQINLATTDWLQGRL